MGIAGCADVKLAYGGADSQYGHLCLPEGDGPHPVVVVIHGGFWRVLYDLHHISGLCDALTAEGFATWSLEYRRVGQPGGGWPGTFQDVGGGAAVLADQARLDLTRVLLLGHSAGGHLALWLAAHSRTPVVESGAAPLPFRPRGAVALAGVVDLRRASALGLGRGAAHDLLGGPPEAVPDRYRAASPAERLPVRVPQVLVHGEEDDVVPLEIATSYVDAARASGDDVRLVALPGTGHFELIDPQTRAWPAVLEAVRGLLN